MKLRKKSDKSKEDSVEEPMPQMPNPMEGEEQPMEQPPMDMGNEPQPMGDEMGNGGEPMMPQGDMGGDDEITSIFNNLTDTDKKAAKNYISSLLDREESQGQGGEMEPQAEMPMESISLTKKQLSKIYEQFGINNLDDESKEKKVEKVKNVNKKSPFRAPKF